LGKCARLNDTKAGRHLVCFATSTHSTIFCTVDLHRRAASLIFPSVRCRKWRYVFFTNTQVTGYHLSILLSTDAKGPWSNFTINFLEITGKMMPLQGRFPELSALEGARKNFPNFSEIS
jgi:hypothetical protein